MILKQSDIVNIQPVARVLPVLAVENIASVVQEMGDRATQFVKGREYFAHVLSKIGDTAYQVKIETAGVNVAGLDGDSLKDLVLKMELGSSAKAGQSLLLRFMHNNPVPTFLLTPSTSNAAGTSTDISSAASLIGQYLKQAENDGVSNRIQATTVVTHTPNNVPMMAHDLKQTVTNSGLFYESHLSDFVQGGQMLTAIKQEPQNQSGLPLAGLMSQQLAVLENQRMAWHGEIWPGQQMDWDIYLEERDSAQQEQWANTSQSDTDRPISSELTLNFPHLGQVSAKVNLVDGRMRINIIAEQAQTVAALNSQKQILSEAIVKNGQQLDALTLVQQALAQPVLRGAV